MATLRECYKDVIDNLDFEGIHKVMKFLGWTYGSDEHTPTIDELKKTCEDLFQSACLFLLENKETMATTSTGGFNVTVEKFEKNERTHWGCTIEFVPFDWSTTTEELDEMKELTNDKDEL